MRETVEAVVCALVLFLIFGLSVWFYLAARPDSDFVATSDGRTIRFSISNACSVPIFCPDDLEQTLSIDAGDGVHFAELGLGANGNVRVQVYRLPDGDNLFVSTGGFARVRTQTAENVPPCMDKPDGRARSDCLLGAIVHAHMTASPEHRRLESSIVYLGAFDYRRPQASNGWKDFGFMPAETSHEQSMIKLSTLRGG